MVKAKDVIDILQEYDDGTKELIIDTFYEWDEEEKILLINNYDDNIEIKYEKMGFIVSRCEGDKAKILNEINISLLDENQIKLLDELCRRNIVWNRESDKEWVEKILTEYNAGFTLGSNYNYDSSWLYWYRDDIKTNTAQGGYISFVKDYKELFENKDKRFYIKNRDNFMEEFNKLLTEKYTKIEANLDIF